ncbi:hypothetical protein Tco_0194824 [Tanacetum coccineum]
MIRMRDDIPEDDMQPWRRFVLTAPPPGCDVAESSAAAARPPRGQYDFVDIVEGRAGESQRTAYETELHEERQAYHKFLRLEQALLVLLEHLKTHMSRMEWQRQSAEDFAVRQMMRIHVLEARAQIDTVEDTGSSS